MNEMIEKIIKESINAPSGSNSQPWEFICSQSSIKIKYLPHKDHPILNYKNRGTLIACGALVENIIITSQHYGFNVEIIIPSNFPNDIVSILNLKPAQKTAREDLYDYIKLRTTNRKPQDATPIEDSQIKYILEETKNYNNIEVTAFNKRDDINLIAENLAYDTYINFNNDQLRNLLFKEILFDHKLAREGKEGLYIKTMEFKPPQEFLIKLFTNKKVFNFFKKLGVLKKIYKEVKNLYSSTSLFLGFAVLNKQEEFLNLGRLIENIWLRATKLNLSCHLITGILFFWQKLNFDKEKIFSEEEADLINKSYEHLTRIINCKNNFLLSAFMRIGKAKPPSAISVKKLPNIIWEE